MNSALAPFGNMSASHLETGLRAVDLFAPIPLGCDILVSGEPKSGGRILGTELALRRSRLPKKPPKVIAFLDATVPDADDYEAEFKETVPGVELLRVPSVSAETLKPHLAHRPFSLGNAVFAFGQEPWFIEGFLRAVKAGRESALFTKLTSFVVTETSVADSFDARLHTLRALAAEAIYPALDASVSASKAIGLDRHAPGHTSVAQAARKAVAQVAADLAPGAIKDEHWPWRTDPAKRPALQALLFLSQPYFCAEIYTGMTAAAMPLADTVKQFQAILEGRYRDTDPALFRFRNTPPE